MNLVQLSGPGALAGKIVGCTCAPDGTCQFVQAAAGLGQAQNPPSIKRQTVGVLGLALLYGAGLGMLGALVGLSGVWLDTENRSADADEAVREGREGSYILANMLLGAGGGLLVLAPLAGIAFVSGKSVARKQQAAGFNPLPEGA